MVREERVKNPIERFARLEKIEPINDERGKFVQDLSEVDGSENIIISCTKASFYDLYDIYEDKPVKIFQTKDWSYWVVMFDE